MKPHRSFLQVFVCLILVGSLHSLTPTVYAVDPPTADTLSEEGRRFFAVDNLKSLLSPGPRLRNSLNKKVVSKNK